jgi:hypothetical protein
MEDGQRVCVVAGLQHREEHHLLELAEERLVGIVHIPSLAVDVDFVNIDGVSKARRLEGFECREGDRPCGTKAGDGRKGASTGGRWE